MSVIHNLSTARAHAPFVVGHLMGERKKQRREEGVKGQRNKLGCCEGTKEPVAVLMLGSGSHSLHFFFHISVHKFPFFIHFPYQYQYHSLSVILASHG